MVQVLNAVLQRSSNEGVLQDRKYVCIDGGVSPNSSNMYRGSVGADIFAYVLNGSPLTDKAPLGHYLMAL